MCFLTMLHDGTMENKTQKGNTKGKGSMEKENKEARHVRVVYMVPSRSKVGKRRMETCLVCLVLCLFCAPFYYLFLICSRGFEEMTTA